MIWPYKFGLALVRVSGDLICLHYHGFAGSSSRSGKGESDKRGGLLDGDKAWDVRSGDTVPAMSIHTLIYIYVFNLSTIFT